MTTDPPYGRPTARELVEAVREFIERDVRDAVDGRVGFHARVAVNALAIVERELELGPDQRVAEDERLAALGVDSEAALAAGLRSGAIDGERAEVRAAIRASVVAKVTVANPGYLEPHDRPAT